MKKPKDYWTAKTLPTLIGQRNGQLTVRAIDGIAEPAGDTILYTQCSCGVSRQISWRGFLLARNPACSECIEHRRRLARRRAKEKTRCASVEKRQAVDLRQPLRIGRVTPAYRALSIEERELVDLIVGSRSYVVPEPGFRDRVMVEAIKIVKLETPAAIRAEYTPKTRRSHTDLYEVRNFAR